MTVPLTTVLREWGRIGLIGFGGPPAHIALLRRRVVEERGWIDPDEFEAAIAACNLLPGPASTQLAIFCAYRVAGRRGALVGGLAFIVPAVVCVILLSLLFLASAPPLWIRGAGDGAGAAVAAVAVSAGWALLKPSWHKAHGVGSDRVVPLGDLRRGRRRRRHVHRPVSGDRAARLRPVRARLDGRDLAIATVFRLPAVRH